MLVCSQIMQVGILGHCLKKMLFRNFKSFHLLEKIIFSDLGQGLPTANGKSGMKWNYGMAFILTETDKTLTIKK